MAAIVVGRPGIAERINLGDKYLQIQRLIGSELIKNKDLGDYGSHAIHGH